MKIRMIVEMASNSEKGIEGLETLIKEIHSGNYQQSIEYGSDGIKYFDCKATVEVLED